MHIYIQYKYNMVMLGKIMLYYVIYIAYINLL